MQKVQELNCIKLVPNNIEQGDCFGQDHWIEDDLDLLKDIASASKYPFVSGPKKSPPMVTLRAPIFARLIAGNV